MLKAVVCVLALGQAGAASYSIESQRDIMQPGSVWALQRPHAATVVQTTDGTIVAAWQIAPTGVERKRDCDTYMSRLINGNWTTPYRVLDGDQVGSHYGTQNPVLFQPQNGPLLLMTKVGAERSETLPYGGNSWGVVQKSTDNGQTWTAPANMGNAPQIQGGRIIGPTKCAPIQLADGTILVPSSNEYGLLESQDWDAITYHFEKSTDGGNSWQFVYQCAKAPNLSNGHVMQPGFLNLGGGNLRVLGRNNASVSGREYVPTATSSNNGQTWSTITQMTGLTHHKTGVCPLTLSDGSHVCLVNKYGDGVHERDQLNLMQSSHSTSWSVGLVLNPANDNRTAHYPQAVQTADGKLHVVFS